ncbi:MAG: hypothetical protein K9M94_07280 [Spirochaetia bacterium]|nr:hypothetical protein [Spirochaetia bacterium]
MRRTALSIGLFFIAVSLSFGQSAGGGISFFFPESLVTGNGSGSVSKEAGLSTSFGFGDFLSVPVGFTYIKASGFMPYQETGDDNSLERMDNTIWYTADTFIPYLRLKAKVPLGPVYFEGFGGVAGAWIVAPQTFDGAVGRYYGSQEATDNYYIFEKLETDISFGFGYQVGGTVGFTIDAISIGIEAIFTDLRAETTVSSSEYYKGAIGSMSAGLDKFEKSFTSRLRGLSIGLNGSYSF